MILDEWKVLSNRLKEVTESKNHLEVCQLHTFHLKLNEIFLDESR